MTIKTLREVVRERLNEGVAAVSAVKDCVRPIYGSDEDGRPEHIGTAVLLELAEGRFIMTAAHVIDFAEETTLYLGCHSQIELSGDFFVSPAPNGDREEDVFDVAILPFPAEHSGSLGTAHFLPESQIADPHVSPLGRAFTCVGFPNSQNRTPPPSMPKIMRPKDRVYSAQAVDLSRLPDRAREGAHILIDFDPKYSLTMDGRRTNSGDPHGMSGGAVFDLGAIATPATLNDPIEPRLAGIIIEGHKEAKVIVATRVAAMLGEFRRNHDLRVLHA